MKDSTTLNIGCGRDIMPKAINVDIENLPGVDIVGDAANPETYASIMPNSITAIYMSHLLEHIANPLPMMEALWNVAAPGCKMMIAVPHGSHDMAFCDPQHVRNYFPSSFQFFGQPAFKRADYNYRGDWEVKSIHMSVENPAILKEPNLMFYVNHCRNFVGEMRASLVAVKPARAVTDIAAEPQIHVHV